MNAISSVSFCFRATSFVFVQGKWTSSINGHSFECTNIHYIYGCCDDNAPAAVEEYQQQFLEHRVSDRQVFSNVHWNLKESSTPPN
jgi:hypothetical protein